MLEIPAVTANLEKQSEPETKVQMIAGVYIDNKDVTVTDTRTRLRWMRCSVGQSWKK